MRGARRVAVGLLFAATLYSAAPSEAMAGPMTATSVGRYTGIVGATLMGFELVFIVEVAAGLRHPAVIVISSIVGAAGAGVGGYFIEKALINAYGDGGGGPGPAAIAFLGVGLAGVIPTLILFKNTSFSSKKRRKKIDKRPAEEPSARAGGMITVTAAGITLGPPAVELAPTVSTLEAEAYGNGGALLAASATETRVTLLRLDF